MYNWNEAQQTLPYGFKLIFLACCGACGQLFLSDCLPWDVFKVPCTNSRNSILYLQQNNILFIHKDVSIEKQHFSDQPIETS